MVTAGLPPTAPPGGGTARALLDSFHRADVFPVSPARLARACGVPVTHACLPVGVEGIYRAPSGKHPDGGIWVDTSAASPGPARQRWVCAKLLGYALCAPSVSRVLWRVGRSAG